MPECRAAVASTADLTVEDCLRTVSVDQHGVFFGMRAVLPGMVDAGGGAIINIASVAGFAHVRHVPNAAYTAAKFAVRGAYPGRGSRIQRPRGAGELRSARSDSDPHAGLVDLRQRKR